MILCAVGMYKQYIYNKKVHFMNVVVTGTGFVVYSHCFSAALLLIIFCCYVTTCIIKKSNTAPYPHF